TRTRVSITVLVAFAFSAFTGPIFAAYTEEILGALQTSDNLTVVAEEATWRSGAVSYMHGAAQIGLLFCCFSVASACAFGPEQLRSYYRTRGRSQVQLFGPRLVVAALAVLVGVVLGALLAWYEIALLFDDVSHGRLIAAFALQSAAIVTLSLLAGVGAIATNSPGPCALATFLAAFVFDFLSGDTGVFAWSPTALLRPYSILDGARVTEFARPLVGSVVVLVVASGLALRRPLRHRLTSPGGQERRSHAFS
ncbi:MAG: hypothetical protein ACR2H3_04095, partial [Acidimicrobiales bacterium]